MTAAALNRRVAALENSVIVIDSLAAFAIWNAKGCDPNVKWDPRLAELFPQSGAYCKAHVAEPAL